MHTIGENDVLQPRAMASPLVYGALKRVSTAVGVATASAADRSFVDQLETRADAAASGLGLSVVGSAVVVAAWIDVVVAWIDVAVDAVARLGCPSRECRRRCTYTNPRRLKANSPSTME